MDAVNTASADVITWPSEHLSSLYNRYSIMPKSEHLDLPPTFNSLYSYFNCSYFDSMETLFVHSKMLTAISTISSPNLLIQSTNNFYKDPTFKI